MKKNILIFIIISAFVFTALGKPPNRRAHDNIYEKFITQKLELLGLKVGKITKVGNEYIVIVKTFSPKINALKRTKPFRSFSLKVTLQGIKPDLNTKMGIVMEDKKMKPGLKGKQLKTGGTKPDLNTKMGIIMEDRKMKQINKNLKILIKKETLLGANFIIDDNDMPAGIIFH